mgnify:CR=1 FL=1
MSIFDSCKEESSFDEMFDKKLSFPDGFTYTVHLQDSVGAENIRGFMDGLIEFTGGVDK